MKFLGDYPLLLNRRMEAVRNFICRSRSWAGVELGTSSIKVVKLSKRREACSAEVIRTEPTPAGAMANGLITNYQALLEVLLKIAEEQALTGCRVITAFDGSELIIRFFYVPEMPVKELAAAVKFEARKYLPEMATDLVIDFVSLGVEEIDGQHQQLIMLAAVAKEIAISYYQLFAAAGLNLIAIDLVPFALYRLLIIAGELKGGRITAVLAIGIENSWIIIMKGQQILFTGMIPFGSGEFTPEDFVFTPLENFAEGLDHLNLEQLVPEVRSLLEYYHGKHPEAAVTRLLVTGDAARVPGISGFFSHKLGLQVDIDLPPLSMPALTSLEPGMAVALGLALREVVF